MKKSFITEFNCDTCGKLFSKRVTIGKETRRNYCCVPCKRADKNSYVSEWTDERRLEYSKKVSGENNPNFGKEWSQEKKDEQSKKIIELYEDNPELRYIVGSANRGVKFDEDRIRRMNENRTPESYAREFSDEVKKAIGKKSAEKWTDEYLANHRKTMEERGHWIRIEDRDPYDTYYKDSNWIGSMIEFFNPDEIVSLNEFGLFNQYSNSKGWVRDHLVPRMVGYEFQLPPQILRHPANMRFVSHAENVSKGFADRKLTKKEKYDTILILFERITKFDKEWSDHQWCLDYIRNYNEHIHYE
jgi:hypothetical protein